jgi:hypothetical protein
LNRSTWAGKKQAGVKAATAETMRTLLLEDLAERHDPEIVEVCRRFVDGEIEVTDQYHRTTVADVWEL